MVAALAVAVALGACDGTSPISDIPKDEDGGTWAYVRGVVANRAQVPQDSAVISVLGEPPAFGTLGQARTDENGRFEVPLLFFLMGPAEYPVAIVVERGTVADTTRGYSVRSFEERPVPDTSDVRVIVP